MRAAITRGGGPGRSCGLLWSLAQDPSPHSCLEKARSQEKKGKAETGRFKRSKGPLFHIPASEFPSVHSC